MLHNEKSFDYIKINIASPARIQSWGTRTCLNGEIIGEVSQPETINYRTLKPEMGGLFCERIFGPVNSWECHCGQYKGVQKKDFSCEHCGVEVIDSDVRRYRMGFIKLASPVTHVWYVKSTPSKIATILDIPLKKLEQIIYLNSSIPIDLWKKNCLINEEFSKQINSIDITHQEKSNIRSFVGAEAIKILLKQINLHDEALNLRALILSTKHIDKKEKLIQRLRIIDQFIASRCDPSWMVLDILPVLPPDLRPIVQLDVGKFATSDLNDLYRRVITINNRITQLKEIEAPEVIIQNEKLILQEAVDALIDNGKRGHLVLGLNNRPLKSLSDIIKGKQGRFRQNLLGKRVDYSGRSVIIVGPELKLHQCGLPGEMAIELFQPFLINRLIYEGLAKNIPTAKNLIHQNKPLIWKILAKVIDGHPVLLNRAPTLHRLGIQAFEPLLIEGQAIKLHPLVCSAFNADFDGDQMAVHIPLSLEAQAEARFLMLAPNNLLSPATGEPILTPSQDMILGCFYLSVNNPSQQKTKNLFFSNFEDVITAYQQNKINVHTFIWVRFDGLVNSTSSTTVINKINNYTFAVSPYTLTKSDNNGIIISKYIRTTPGRILLNQAFNY